MEVDRNPPKSRAKPAQQRIARKEKPIAEKANPQQIATLVLAYLLSSAGMTRIGCLYARITFEEMLGRSRRQKVTDMLLACRVRGKLSTDSSQRLSAAYGRLSESVHGHAVSRDESCKAIVSTYLLTEAVR